MSETDISIPKEALEAAYNARRNGDTLEDICLAMLKAWPGMGIEVAQDESEAIILPLPKENTNAEA